MDGLSQRVVASIAWLALPSLDPAQITGWCGAIIAIGGVLALVRKWELLKSRADLLIALARERQRSADAIRERDDLRGMIQAFEPGLRELRAELDDLRARQLEDRNLYKVSTRFIIDLIAHIRDGGTANDMPPIPPELQFEVVEGLRDVASERSATA